MSDRTFRWGEWELAPLVPHLAEHQACASCSRTGPLQLRFGFTLQPGRAVRKLVRASDVCNGVRPHATTVWSAAYWALTHTAFRCPGCREEMVYGEVPGGGLELVEERYQPPHDGGPFVLAGIGEQAP